MLKPIAPAPAQRSRTLLESVGVPIHVQTTRLDPEQSMATTISKNLWPSNPGYIIRDGQKLVSTMKRDFIWDEEEVSCVNPSKCLQKSGCRQPVSCCHHPSPL